MNVVNARYHFISGFHLFTLVVQATNTGVRSHGYEARVEPHKMGNACTAAVWSSPEGMHDCVDEFNFDFQNYRQTALFMNANFVSSSSSQPQISCLLAVAHEVITVHDTDFWPCSTDTDFSRDL